MGGVTYYSPNKVLTFGKVLNIVMGNRSSGKSFGWKNFLLNRFIKKGRQFLYVRRYVNEIQGSRAEELFNDVADLKYPDHDIYIKKQTVWVDGEKAGWLVGLSATYKIKSSDFKDVDFIILDEAFTEDGRYLQDEVNKLLNLYQTVARGGGKVIRNNVKIVLISNAVSMINPYIRFLQAYDIKEGYTVGEGWVIECFKNESVNEEIKKSEFYKLIHNTDYAEYAMNNAFYLDNNCYIDKPDLTKAYYYATILYKEKFIALYLTQLGQLYCSRKVNKQEPNRFSVGCYNENYYMLENSHIFLKELRQYFNANAMRFSNIEVKGDMLEILNILTDRR